MLLATAMSGNAFAQDLRQSIRQDMPNLLEVYRDFHTHPELSMQETRSAARLAEEARRLGFTVTRHELRQPVCCSSDVHQIHIG